MGSQLDKLAEKHGEFVPEFNNNLCAPRQLPTGGVFIPMSAISGDLDISHIPQIVLNAGMSIHDYKDCIYLINETSIRLYSRIRKLLRRISANLATMEMYYYNVDMYISEIYSICFDLNEIILKQYNILFIPFVNVLNDNTSTKHFGIIIDYRNKSQLKKVTKKNLKQQQKLYKQKQKQQTKDTKNSKNSKNNKQESQTMAALKEKVSVFSCFRLGKSHKNKEESAPNEDITIERGDAADTKVEIEETGMYNSKVIGNVEKSSEFGKNGRLTIDGAMCIASVSDTGAHWVASDLEMKGNINNNHNNGNNSAISNNGNDTTISKESGFVISNDYLANHSNTTSARNSIIDSIDLSKMKCSAGNRSNVSLCPASSNGGERRMDQDMCVDEDEDEDYDIDNLNDVDIQNELQKIRPSQSYTQSAGKKFGLQIYIPRHMRPNDGLDS